MYYVQVFNAISLYINLRKIETGGVYKNKYIYNPNRLTNKMFQNLYKVFLAIIVCSCMSNTTIANPLDDFSNISYDNTVPFVPPITYGKVVKVYDGDTITIAAKLPYPQSPVYRIAVRLNGIDTPEIKGQTQKEKDLAKKIRDTLQTKLMNKIVQLKNTSSEKYGRLLADVYLDDVCINTWMIEQGFAVAYSGGTKVRPDEWM